MSTSRGGFLRRGGAYTLRMLPARVVVLRSGQRKRVEAAQRPPKVVRYRVAGSVVTNARRARLSGAAFDALLGTAIFKAAKSGSCTVQQYVDPKSLDARALRRRAGSAALTEPTVRIGANVSIGGQVSDVFGANDAPLPQLLNVLNYAAAVLPPSGAMMDVTHREWCGAVTGRLGIRRQLDLHAAGRLRPGQRLVVPRAVGPRRD